MYPRARQEFGAGRLLTTTEAATYLRVSRQWINVLVRQGKLHPVGVGTQGGRRSPAYTFEMDEVEDYRLRLHETQIDWIGIQSALEAWQAAVDRHDEPVAHRAHLEASLQMAKGDLISMMSLNEQVSLSKFLQAKDIEGIKNIVEQVAESAKAMRRWPRRRIGSVLRKSWATILREMYLRYANSLPELTIRELEDLSFEGSLAESLNQLAQRSLIDWTGGDEIPHITEIGCERAEHVRYVIRRRYEKPGQTMDWLDWADTYSESQVILNRNSELYPDALHSVDICEHIDSNS